jgi:hypothetical protein
MIKYVVVYQLSKEVAISRTPAVMGPFHDKVEATRYADFLSGQGYRWVRVSVLIPAINVERFIS